MSDPNSIKPTGSELEILQILWEKGPSTVREVHEILSRAKESGYTTTLKLLQIMYEKGLVFRDTANRSHVYRAAVSRERTRKQMLDRMVRTLFAGSSSSLVLEALGHYQASEQELDAIRAYLAKMDAKKKGSHQ